MAELVDDEKRESEAAEYLLSVVNMNRKYWTDSPHELVPSMLALLLDREVIFLNTNWWEDDWPADARKTLALCVNCNDVFAWGCSDAETIYHDEIPDLFEHWERDREWGAAVWCMKKRQQMPQKPVEALIRKAGIWDLGAIVLPPNTQDAQVQALFQAIRDKNSAPPVSPTPPMEAPHD